MTQSRRTWTKRAAVGIAAAAVIGGGSLLTPSASAAPTTSAALACDGQIDKDSTWIYCESDEYDLQASGSYDDFDGRERIEACDHRTDGRYVATNIEWSQNGELHHSWVIAMRNHPHECSDRLLGIPTGTKVHIWICVQQIGCSPKYYNIVDG